MKTQAQFAGLPVDPGSGAPNNPGVICLANETRFIESYFNEPLTTYAVGWRDPNNIEATLNFCCPPVPTSRRFTYREWINKEEFYSETDDIRAIGSDFKRVEYTGKETEGKTLNKGLTMLVDLDEVADKTNWEQTYVAKLMRRLFRNDLRRAIGLLDDGTNTAKTWDTSAGKDPDQDVLTDLIAATTASGIRPNRVLYGETAWDKRGLAHRAQTTAGGFASAAMTQQQVASILMVDGVMVSKERYQSDASTKTQILNNLVLEFFQTNSADTEDPSNVKRFVTPISGAGGNFRVYTQQISAKLYVITVEHYSNILSTSTLGLRKLTIS
jgi:hypothetical protein